MDYLAHAEKINTGLVQDNTLNIYLLLTFVVIILVILVSATVSAFLNRYSKRPNKLSRVKELLLARLVLVFSLAGFVGASIDIWWHRAVGRDNIFEPPHLVIYGSAIAVVIVGFYAWYLSRGNDWKKILVAITFIPLSAPLDNFWHILFGIEDLSRPILLSWSPPHLLLSVSMACIFIFIIPILMKEKRTLVRRVSIDLCLAGILSVALFVLWPFHPTEGFGQVVGFWGAGIIAIPFILLQLVAQKKSGGPIDATRLSIVTLLFFLLSYGEELAPEIIILAHDRAPIWIIIFAVVLPGIFLDYTKRIMPNWLRGGLAGLIWASFSFGIFSLLVEPAFAYSLNQVTIALVTSFIGGVVASIISERIF